MTTFIDTNILIYLSSPVSPHHAWSVSELNRCKANGPVIVCDMVYCEFTIGMPSKEAADDVVNNLSLERLRIGDDALFRAGRAYLHYKNINKGPKLNVLPDFIVGAAAEVYGIPLITLNAADYKYFENISLITR